MGAPFKGVVYFNGEQPMVIDVNGKGGAWGSAGLLLLLLLTAEQTGTHVGVSCEHSSGVTHRQWYRQRG
jgi:hypothetical protein